MSTRPDKSIYVYRPPAAPTLADFRAGGERRKAFWRYYIRDNLNNLVDLSVHFGLKLLPMDLCSAAGAKIGLFVMPRFHKVAVRRARENLKVLMPDASEAEREAVLRTNWENQGRLMTEFSIIRRVALTPGRVKGLDVAWARELAAAARWCWWGCISAIGK